MDKDNDLEREKIVDPVDEVDFTSGFETQYRKEYRPLPTGIVAIPPPDPQLAWYRDLNTVLVVVLLIAVLLGGSILLTTLVFTVSFVGVCGIVAAYIVLALLFIYLEVKSIHVR